MSQKNQSKVVIDLSVDSDDDFEFIPRSPPVPPPPIRKRKFPINDLVPKRRVSESDNLLLSASRDWSKVFDVDILEEDSFILNLSEFDSEEIEN